jgi:glycosyltransferase involved in cell wall biosynthesis/2-polyprenyl-3-methyl-5-hydroxy-6-metoxy-1,4-benzoquinol methylase
MQDNSQRKRNQFTDKKQSQKDIKLAFFSSQGGTSFLDAIINELSEHYTIKTITIKNNEDYQLINQWMSWADICWFEWCDGLIIYGSKLAIAKEKKIICRLHSYEAFANYPSQVNWNNVDKLVFVAEHIQKLVLEKFKISHEITIIVPNGVNDEEWTFKQRTPGFKIAYVGYINHKKGPMLLLQTMKAIYDQDNRYTFYIAGQFQEPRYFLYFQQMIKEFGLENNYFFEGWQEDLDSWLEDKNYILCSSLLESQNMSVMQAMAKGIKPIIHNFVGAEKIYPREYLWNTIDEAIKMVTDKSYNSMEYKKIIAMNYSLEKQLNTIDVMIRKLLTKKKKDVPKYNDQDYWTQRLNSNFNIEGVGYFGLGQIHNELLYQSRIDMLDSVLNISFDKISDKKILELGPGTGIFTEYFHNKEVKAYYAMDIVRKSISELSKKYSSYNFKQGDISDGRNYEGKYDLIFAAAVLLHITNEDNYEICISNIANHLENNGLCILMDPVSIIETKSASPHVVIRNKDYIQDVLKKSGLELIAILPISCFINYPFDREVIGIKGKFSLELFYLISTIFSENQFSQEEKQLIGKYLHNKEKELLYQNNYGLSEKLLIIQKKGQEHKASYTLNNILDIDTIRENIRESYNCLNQTNLVNHHLFHKTHELITHLMKISTQSISK